MTMQSKVSRRLTEPTSAELNELIYAPRLSSEFLVCFPYLTDINQAHSLMLKKQHLISADVGKKIAFGLKQMESEGHQAVPLDPQREDSYFNYEARLIELIGQEAGGRMHIARSRNDILATIDRMRARDVVLRVLLSIKQVISHALEGAERYKSVIMSGHTHLQPAQPITYGFYLAGVATALTRDAERLSDVWSRLNVCPLGAGALAGTTFNIDRAESAKLLGFDSVTTNTLDSVASRDFCLEILNALVQIALTWSRVSQDYFIMVTHEFGAVEFPDSVTGTSSIMPQKKNPVILEYLKTKASDILGNYVSSASASKMTNFSHTNDNSRGLPRGLWESENEILRCLSLFDLVIRTARPNASLMADRVKRNFTSATDLADALVVDAGMSFREAHHVVGGVVRAAMDAGMPADHITPAMVDAAAIEEVGRPAGLSAAAVEAALDPEVTLGRRNLPGGPGPLALARDLPIARVRLEKLISLTNERQEKLSAARTALKNQIADLAVQ